MAAMLHGTVSPGVVIEATVRGSRVVVSTPGEKPTERPVHLTINGDHLLDLHVEWRCTWDHAGRYIAVVVSNFAVAFPVTRNPLLRIEYVKDRTWAQAHIQVHAERADYGYMLAKAGREGPAQLYDVHLPVGDRRFRPCLEDIVEMAVWDLGVDTVPGWQAVVDKGRNRWRLIQAKAALRDAIREHPDQADTFHRLIDEAVDGDMP